MQLLAAGGHGTPPRVVPSPNARIGNRAVAALLSGTLQREAQGPSAPERTKQAPAKAAKVKDSTKEFNSYAGLVNAFHHMTMAAINDNGVGLGAIKFDRDLNPQHRRLLDQVRNVLVGQTKKERAAQRAASAAWPSLAAKLLKAVDEARPLGLMPTMLAAVTDDVALIGRVYLKAKPAGGEPEEVTYKGLNDAVDAVNDLVWAFHKGGEAGPGIVQEQVPSRKDIVIPKSVLDGNLQARTELAQVQLGSHLTARHRKVLERLRSALTAARSETAGSAWVGLQQFRAIRGEIDYILGGANLQQAVEHTELRARFNEIDGKLAAHYAAVHQENLAKALTKERPAGQDEADKSVGAMHPKLAARIKESRVIDDFKYALDVIENHVTQSPVRTNEWILTSGGTVIRIRPDQAKGLKEAARTQVKAYMASIVTEMVEAWDTYDQIKRGTGGTRRKILGALGGADDPGDQSDARNNVIEVRNSKVYPLADQGKFVEALEEILRQKADVDRRAIAVGEYDADLDKGYGRLAKAAAVVQVALVALVPVAGEAAMATTIVEGAVVEGASGLAVTATGVGAGAGGAFLGETGRQLAFEDKMDWGKSGSAAWTGGTIGFGAGGGAMTKGLSNLVAPAAEGSELVGANMFASSVVGAGQDVLGGGNGVTGMATGGLGSMAGHLVDAAAPLAKAPMTNMALQGVAGAGVSYATNQDMLTGAVGNMTGAIAAKATMPKPPASGPGHGSAVTEGHVAGPGPANLNIELPGVGARPVREQAGAAAPTGEAGRVGPGMAGEREGHSAPASTTMHTGPTPLPNASGVKDFDVLIKSWQAPDPAKLRPASIRDADGKVQQRPNIKVHEEIAKPDLDGLLVELEKTPWGSRIAEGLRGGELKLTLLPPWELPFGGLHYPGGETYLAWSGSIQEIAATMHHEGSHWLDPHGVSGGGSKLGMEAEARVFEYEYRDLVGLPAYDQIHAATRLAYENTLAATRTPEMPLGDLRAARAAADRAMLEAMRDDAKRVAVETRQEEQKKLDDRRNGPIYGGVDAPTSPEVALPEELLEIEVLFGDEATSPGTKPAKAGAKARPETTAPRAAEHDPVIPPPAANAEEVRLEGLLASAVEAEARAAADEKRAMDKGDKGAAAAARERYDAAGVEIHKVVERIAALAAPAGKGSQVRGTGTPAAPSRGKSRPLPNPGSPVKSADAGLVGDKDRPGRRAKVLPESAYRADERPLTDTEKAMIEQQQEAVRIAIEAKLQGLPSGKESGLDASEFRRITAELAGNPGLGTNAQILQHVETVWSAVHDPRLVAEIVSKLYGESLRKPGSGTGLDPVTKAVLRAAALSGPLHVAPPRTMIHDDQFFVHWVTTGRRWLDLGTGEDHGGTSHLIQDLVVDEAFHRAGSKMTAKEFRKLLAGATGPTPTEVQSGPGNRLWIAIFDAAVGINTPEKLMPALREIPGLEGLR